MYYEKFRYNYASREYVMIIHKNDKVFFPHHRSPVGKEAIIYIAFAAQMLTWGTLIPNSARHYPVFYLTTHPPIPDG